MNSLILPNILRFIFLFLIQLLVFNKVQLHGFVQPFIYILFILFLPIRMPKWLVMVIAFIYGIMMDFFLNTGGVHAAACVAVGYVRPIILGYLAPRSGYESIDFPNVKDLGIQWFLIFSGILIALFHLVYFLLLNFSFTNFGFTLLKIILSSLTAIIISIVLEFLILNKSKS